MIAIEQLFQFVNQNCFLIYNSKFKEKRLNSVFTILKNENNIFLLFKVGNPHFS